MRSLLQPCEKRIALGAVRAVRRVERKGDMLTPHGARLTGHVWLHDGCWEQWHEHCQAAARAEMAEIGIAPGSIPDAST